MDTRNILLIKMKKFQTMPPKKKLLVETVVFILYV